MKKLRFFYLITVAIVGFLFSSCGGDSHENVIDKWPFEKEDSVIGAKPRYLWIDAAANFSRYANSRENIATDLQKAKDAGITDIVVDVRPSMGDVLYNTSYTSQITKLDYWEGDQYKFYERTATWDYLQAFIDAGHKLGLKVNAGFNTFAGGCLYAYGLGEQGIVFRDAEKKSWVTTLNLKEGLTNEMDLTSTDPADPQYCGTKFLNPCNDDVQQFILNLITDLCKYDIDGLFLDRCRYDNLASDFSEVSKEKFMKYAGISSMNFPDDIMSPGTTSLPTAQPKYFKAWLSFRAKTIHDFVQRVVSLAHGLKPALKVGVYVGGWYSTYYEMGVNWASNTYPVANKYPDWADENYQKYGYADMLDFMLIGAYAPADQVYGQGEWTMQGFCRQARLLLGNKVKFAGGPDVGNPTGFADGKASKAVEQSVDACINEGDGYFVFDMVHIRQYNYWASLKAGIDKYLNSIKKKS